MILIAWASPMQQNGNRNGEKSSYNENYSPHHPFTDVRRYSGAAADFVGIFVGIWEFSHKNSNYISTR